MQVDQLTGATVGRYQVRGRLQLLPYAAVHRGAGADGRPVLIWTFGEPYSGAMGFLEALQRLAGDRRAESISGLAHTLEIGSQDGASPLVYLVGEDAPGGFLVGLLQRGKAPGVLATVSALAATVDRMHEEGIVHGDLQPATVAFDADGRPLLVGTGIRTVVTRVSPEAAWLDATRGFRPPGRLAEPGVATDRYGLAALAYYLLVGRPPCADGTTPPPSRIRPQLPAGLDEVVMRALAPDPRQRYRSAREMAAELRRAVSTRSAPGAGPTPGARPVPQAPPAPPPATTGPAPSPRPTATARPESVAGRPPNAPTASPPPAAPTHIRTHPWMRAEEDRTTSLSLSLVPVEPIELQPEVRRRSGIVLLVAVVALAGVLLILAATGRLYL